MRRLRRRYGHAKQTHVQLVLNALRDWSAGRAFYRKGRYWLRPLQKVTGVWTVGYGRPRIAPWSKAAVAQYPGPSELHTEARIMYPEPVAKQRLIEAMVREEGLS